MTALGELLSEVQPGFACGKEDPNGVFQFRMHNVSKTSDIVLDKRRRVPRDAHRKLGEFAVRPADVLFNATNSPDGVGKSILVPELDEPAVFSNHFFRLRPDKSRLNAAYLWRWLQLQFQRGVFRGMCRQWVNQATVSREGLLALHLSVPPLEEQRRIAAILDQIDALRAKRRQVLAHLDTLTQSIFHEMFSTRSYEARPFADVCERVTVGVVIRPASYYVDVGVPALRTLNVKPGRIVLDDLVYFSHESNDGPLAKSRLRSGDLVVTRTGNAGVTAVVPPALDGANAIDLIVASPDPRTVTSTFLECLLNSDLGKRIVSGEARGQIQQHFNVGSLKNAMIPVPPLDRQCDFAARVVEVNTQRVAVQRALAADDELFISLQARAFRGEL